jgi:hypothetical protein
MRRVLQPHAKRGIMQLGVVMPTATIHFKELIQDSQNYGSDDENMVSRVFFDLQVDDKKYPGAYANLRQTVGATATDPIEVSAPAGYVGPFDHEKFRAEVEKYFRGFFGSPGSSVNLGPGGKKVRMRNCRYRKLASVSFEVPKLHSP